MPEKPYSLDHIKEQTLLLRNKKISLSYEDTVLFIEALMGEFVVEVDKFKMGIKAAGKRCRVYTTYLNTLFENFNELSKDQI